MKYTENDEPCDDGDMKPVILNSKSPSIPKEFSLAQNYPNPFNPVTNIKFGLPKSSLVSLIIYDVLGREITRLVNSQTLEAGNYSYDFDASNLPSGIYYYKLSAGEFSDVKKMAVLK
ncbi:MAG: T9SS type A sorting domain-containing protein [Chlorobi bacterium]|nr:T9SS type A sorting domain-containing protein [Chlorobiota bacterium]MCI0715741.1 T9SS type A sorting domain-containing protein [Chlorobiota bacterium]